MKFRLIYIYLLTTVYFAVVSCDDYLDVSHELAEEQTLDKIFSTPRDVRKWHRQLYTGIPNSMNFFQATSSRINQYMTNVWTNLADEILPTIQQRDRYPYSRALSPVESQRYFGRWHLYQLIRQANILLEEIQEIPKRGQADYLDLEEVEDLKVQARFLRAFYYYLLFELYGPVPIIEESISPTEPNIDFERNSVDEVVDYVFRELTEVENLMDDPDYSNTELLAKPTKGAALAIKARLLIYAASPLFNGGYEEALNLTNNDGKKLFPDYNSQKWEKALNALQKFIDYANAGHYELHKEYYENGELNPYASVYEVHQKFNKEFILARSDDQGVVLTSGANGNFDRYFLPRGARGGTTNTGGSGILQELVDDYFMMDGLSIYESPLYSEDGYSEEGEDLTNQTNVGTFKMFINREPRFYNDVFYNGRNWHVGNEVIEFNKGGNSDNRGQTPLSGHMLYKRINRRVYHQSPHPSEMYRPISVFRLAEFYLLYAEALNEVNPADSRVIEYVDKIRERAGIPLLADIKPEIIGKKEAQREAVRAEMRIELATEGQRYFDVKRWMIAENEPGKGGFGGIFTGMDMNATTIDGFYKRTPIQDRVFERCEYLAPIPQSEILKSTLLVQNPGY